MNEVSTTIDGLKFIISSNNIHIEDSYTVIYPPDMRMILKDAKKFLADNNITMDTPFNYRSIGSMIREWITHNNAYYLNIRPEQSRSVDLNWPQPWYAPIIYFFGSLIIL